MIDPTKPMYDADGREWAALRMPDGSVFSTNTDDACFLVACDSIFNLVSFETGYAPRSSWGLSNTKPQEDCDVRLHTALDDCAVVHVLVRRRNGVITAEVVND